MALSPEKIQELRAKVGIAPGGISAGSPENGGKMMGAEERIAKLQKMSAMRTEAAGADAAATKANSKLGIAKETIKQIPQKLLSSTIDTGKRLGEAAAAGDVQKDVIAADTGFKDMAIKVLRTIHENKTKGKDTSRLEKAYNEIAGHTQTGDMGDILPTLNDSNFSAIADSLGVGLDLISGGAATPAKTAAKEGAEAVAKAAAPVIESVAKNRAQKGATKTFQKILDITMPKVTTKTGTEGIEQGRMVEPGIFSKGKLTATPNDNLVAESVQGVINPRKSVAQNIELVKQKVAEINAGVREMIATRKTPFNEAQLRTRLNAVKEENKLVFASDATAERVYDAVVDTFVKNVGKKDTLGLFEARQTFDKIPAIKKLLQTEGLGENVKRQIVLDVRRAANEYVAEQLPKNNPYRKALMTESRMIEAIGNMAEKNVKQLGKNKIQLLTEEYPILKWLAGGLGISLLGGGGVGVGSSIINSSDR